MAKPSIPKGTRDFSPQEVAKRGYIINILKKNFELFGFQPIETPSFENLETLMGKYGEEGDRLIFKILNSGEYFESISSIISSYCELVVKATIEAIANQLSKNKNSTSIQPYIHGELNTSYIKNHFITKEFVEDMIDFINKTITSEYKLKNFYSEDLKNILEKEITYLENDYSLQNEILINALQDCTECSVLENDIVKIYTERRIEIVLGKIFLTLKSKKLTSQISEKALRYDLTVPFARYVVQHQNEIDFPFKR